MESLANYGSDDESGDYSESVKNDNRSRRLEEDANYDEIGMDESSEESNNNHTEHFSGIGRERRSSVDGWGSSEGDTRDSSCPENNRNNQYTNSGKDKATDFGNGRGSRSLSDEEDGSRDGSGATNKPDENSEGSEFKYFDDVQRRHSSDMEMDDGVDDLENYVNAESSEGRINETTERQKYTNFVKEDKQKDWDKRRERKELDEQRDDDGDRRRDDYKKKDDKDDKRSSGSNRREYDDRTKESDKRKDSEKQRDDRDKKRSPERRDHGKKRSHSPDKRDRDRERDRERERERDRDRRDRERERERDRSHRSTDRRSPKHPRRSSRSPERSWKARKLEKKAAVLNKLGIELKADVSGNWTPRQLLGEQLKNQIQEVEAKTGVTLPTYYNPGVMNPLKYAQQIQKRKLLWGNKANESKTDGTGQSGGGPPAVKQWVAATFKGDNDGRMTEKFKRLMGIKDDTSAGGSSSTGKPPETKEIIQKQEELFSNMEAQYQVARMATHTHRGVGLGFGTFQVPPR